MTEGSDHPLVLECRSLLPDYLWDSLNAEVDDRHIESDGLYLDLVACDQKDVLSFVGRYPIGPRKLATIQGEGACEGVACVLIPGEKTKNAAAVGLMVFQAFRLARLEMYHKHEFYVNQARITLQTGTDQDAERLRVDVKNEPMLTWRERVELLRLYEERARDESTTYGRDDTRMV